MTGAAALLLFTLALGTPADPAIATPPAVQSPTPARPQARPDAAPAGNKRVANGDAYYLFLLARDREMDGDAEGAIKLYQEAARLDPTSGSILAELAGAYARQNRAREAIATAEAALQADKDTVEAHLILGTIYAAYAQGEPATRTPAAVATEKDYASRAITHLEAVLTDRGATASPDLLLMLSRLYLKTSAADKAIPLLARLVSQEPDAIEGVALLAEAYSQAGRSADAAQLLERAAGREPSFYPVLAALYERSGRWTDAADAYQKAVQGGATGVEVKRRWAVALLNTRRPGDATRALDLLRAMVADNPKDTRALYLLAQAQNDLHDHNAAEATARQLVALDPSDVRGYVVLAEVLMSAERPGPAEDVLRQARAKFPDDLTVLFELGAVYDRQKRYTAAEDVFKQVIARDPLHAQALNYLGYMLADRGQRLPESVDYIRRALAVEPDNPAYLDSLGWAYFKMNRLDLAESNLRKAATDRPNDSAVQDHWGDLLQKLGRRDEAIAAWRRALAGDGQDVDRAAIEAKIRASEKAGKK